ncbi:hypothetical protein B0O99DRAFT_252715 [Bisporella sp. PMI_857]|nr:hypothetical protein B0O99DRAFT_252715 [Bisporella sp. PMI_857]
MIYTMKKVNQSSLFSFGFKTGQANQQALSQSNPTMAEVKVATKAQDFGLEISDKQAYSSSLTPPPPSSNEALTSAIKRPTPNHFSPPPAKRTSAGSSSPLEGSTIIVAVPDIPGRIVRGSDDEDGESDSSLEDLSVLLQTQRPDGASNLNPSLKVASTPAPSKSTRASNSKFHTSPLAVLPKYKFDMKSLATNTKKDDAIEASSKRFKAIDDFKPLKDITNRSTLSRHTNLLESVVAETDGAELHKVTRAIKRTEATLPEFRFYFFETQPKSPKSEKHPFPNKAISPAWRDELKDPLIRYQTFVSGFAEDMVGMGKALPDEIFLWMLNEICIESDDVLRTSYCNVLRQSHDQIKRLVVPETVRNMFSELRAQSSSIDLDQKVRTVPELPTPYPKLEWANLRTAVRLFGIISKTLQQDARTHIVCMLLRMSLDRAAFDNIDVFDMVQETLFRLCRYVPSPSWNKVCTDICTCLLASVEEPTLRLHMVDIIPSTSPRTHDLRRRLAMTFYFKDTIYSTKDGHSTMDLTKFIARLDDEDFDTDSETDYRELGALISLLDVAVDDGRNVNIDLKNEQTEKEFDNAVEGFSAAIDDIIECIGNPGAGFISKIEAKEVLSLVSRRIGDTVRSRPKPKETVFKAPKEKLLENLDRERRGMSKFISRPKDT